MKLSDSFVATDGRLDGNRISQFLAIAVLLLEAGIEWTAPYLHFAPMSMQLLVIFASLAGVLGITSGAELIAHARRKLLLPPGSEVHQTTDTSITTNADTR